MKGAERLDPQLLGKRLLLARKRRGLTQDAVAQELGLSRPTIIAVEKGQRVPTSEELVKLAKLYGRSVHEFVRPDMPAVELQPHLRALITAKPEEAAELEPALDELEKLASDYRGLERMMKAPLLANYPPEIPIPTRGSIEEWAEDAVVRERSRLGLGDQPVLALRDLLEAEVGLRIFYWPLPSSISGIYAYSAESGPCLLVNRKHPPERRRATIAHEYGHFLTERYKPGVDYLHGAARKPISERFVEAFGMAFLMPRTGVRRYVAEIIRSSADFQVADLCRVAQYFFVSVQAMALRLEQLKLINEGSYEFLLERGFKPHSARSELALEERSESDSPFPTRYLVLALRAFDEELVSEGQLARFLRTDRVESRRLVSEWRERASVEWNGQTVELPLEGSLLRKEG
ncbi:MAG: ImmA/IrrE family metallo-endopeptidase [Phycisphaerae bacterium]|nr:ImmA/IrrE family metallo-endopeptidase [Phycisphaerae bacterium]